MKREKLRIPGVVSIQHIEHTDVTSITIPKTIRREMNFKPQEQLRYEVATTEDGNKFLKLFRYFPSTMAEPQPA